jgi:hypothetical protein
MEWRTLGVYGEFYNLGGLDPCVEGDFCRADVTGRQWVTMRGLQVAETITRLQDLSRRRKRTRGPAPSAIGFLSVAPICADLTRLVDSSHGHSTDVSLASR